MRHLEDVVVLEAELCALQVLGAVRLELRGVDELLAAASAPDAVDLLRRVAPRDLLAVRHGDVPRRGLERRARAVEELRRLGAVAQPHERVVVRPRVQDVDRCLLYTSDAADE